MAKLCRAGVQLREQIDDDYPSRSRKSDGWIADYRHMAKGKSDHIPKNGVVRAIDIDADLNVHPEEAYALAEKIRKCAKRGDDRIAYVIFAGKIAARVVVLPEPVGPVTSTSPLGFSLSSRTIGGRLRSSISGILEDSARRQAAMVPRSL